MKSFSVVIVALFVICSLGHAQISGVPRKISYQGVLSYHDAKGKVKLVKNGTYVVKFALYDDATAGNLLYTEDDTVAVVKGVYSVTIGEDGTPTGKLAGNFTLLNWLEVSIASGPETKITYPYDMPRVQLTSVPFAVNASRSDVASNADTATYARAASGCTLAIGQVYAGGYIFYLDLSGCHGLVADMNDLGALTWSNNYFVTNALADWVGGGRANTERIITFMGSGNVPAADACRASNAQGYQDWYLPSKVELNMMYVNLKLSGVGGFAEYYYWSSTEFNNGNAWAQRFTTSVQYSDGKNGENYVRAVRAF